MSAAQAKRGPREVFEGAPKATPPVFDPDLSYTVRTPVPTYAGVAHKVQFTNGRADLHPYTEEEDGIDVQKPWPTEELRMERVRQLEWFHNQGYDVRPMRPFVPMPKE